MLYMEFEEVLRELNDDVCILGLEMVILCFIDYFRIRFFMEVLGVIEKLVSFNFVFG